MMIYKEWSLRKSEFCNLVNGISTLNSYDFVLLNTGKLFYCKLFQRY